MSGMNTQKILELLGTTPASKMETLRREETFPVCAEESANEMLNAELFGTSKPAGKTVVRKAASEEVKKPVAKKIVKKATEGAEEAPVAPADDVPDAADVEPSEVIPEDLVSLDGLTKEGDVALYFDYDPNVVDKDLVAEIKDELSEAGITLEPAEKEENADEAVATEGCKKLSRRCSKECIHTEAAPAAEAQKSDATEMVVETGEGKFPESFNFDEKAFAEEYGIDPETLTCIYRPEDPDAQIAEAIEISFTYEDAKVVLTISADNSVAETVDAEEVDPQFSAEFQQVENDDGVMEDVFVLNLVEETDDEGEAVKSEGDEETKSEGDEKHKDEDGKGTTDEFIEEAGLNIDGFYADQHNLPKADKSVHEVKKNANESLAARIIRTRK